MTSTLRLLMALAPAAAAALIESQPAAAQTVETHRVEIISAEDVGPFQPTHQADLQRVSRRIEQMTNHFRVEQGLEPVESNDKLQRVAADFAEYMARTGRFGHYASGKAPSERVKEHDYEYCVTAENIAYDFQAEGFSTENLAESIVTGWKDSEEHRKNMLLPAATHTGVAVVQSRETGVYFAVQEFGRPKSAAIEFRVANRTETTVRYKLADHVYELLPRFIRAHTICLPEELTLLDGEETVATLHPADGDRFTIRGRADRLQVERD